MIKIINQMKQLLKTNCKFPHTNKAKADAKIYTLRTCGHQLTELAVCQEHILELHKNSGTTLLPSKCDICKTITHKYVAKVISID